MKLKIKKEWRIDWYISIEKEIEIDNKLIDKEKMEKEYGWDLIDYLLCEDLITDKYLNWSTINFDWWYI